MRRKHGALSWLSSEKRIRALPFSRSKNFPRAAPKAFGLVVGSSPTQPKSLLGRRAKLFDPVGREFSLSVVHPALETGPRDVGARTARPGNLEICRKRIASVEQHPRNIDAAQHLP